jgi:hypothetical protein
LRRMARPEPIPKAGTKGEAAERAERTTALVDGSNVAHAVKDRGVRLENIRLVCEKLRADGLEPIVIADAALRHQIDDTAGFEAMVDGGGVRQAPAGTDADYFLASFARELDAAIVSNDRFRELHHAFPEVQERIIRFMIVADEVVLERRAKPR